MTLRDRIEDQVAELRAARDELAVQLELAKMEAKDLWGDLEKQWEHAESKLKVLGDTSQEAAEEVGEAAQLVLDEIKEGYTKLRNLI
jgi:hypothetical protein